MEGAGKYVIALGARARQAMLARSCAQRVRAQDPGVALSVNVHHFFSPPGAVRHHPDEDCMGLIHMQDLFRWRTGQPDRTAWRYWSRDGWWPAADLATTSR